MPGFYADGEYDIAGFIVGAVDRKNIIDGSTIIAGDVLIGLRSTGLHTNGYSLARRVLFDAAGYKADTWHDELGASIGDVLLAPHRSYLSLIRPLIDERLIKGMAHVTGGGITENLPRVLPEGCAAVVRPARWRAPAIFQLIQRLGSISTDEMFRAFNMGIGLILVCAAADRERVLDALHGAGERDAGTIGEVVVGDRQVQYLP
jgi:phosphoribosylformylglycinamidine cyclo-ligase